MADSTSPTGLIRERKDVRAAAGKANRLDLLALALESNAVCVAATIINGCLYIAANEIYEGHPKIKTQEFIQRVCDFFKDVAIYGSTHEAGEILEEIVGKRANVSAAVAKAVVPDILAGSGSADAVHILEEIRTQN